MSIKLLQPIDKVYITQKFGERPAYYKRYGLRGHNGIDYRTRFIGSPLGRRYITAAAAGTIEIVRFDATGYGVHVRIRHLDGSMTIYGHLTKPYVSKGDKVTAGQRIGLSGNTGDSSAPHLHFEIRMPGQEKNGYFGAVDPTPYFII